MTTEHLRFLITMNERALRLNLEGIDHARSLEIPTAANSLNWVVGHLVASRDVLLRKVGLPPQWDEATTAPYARGAERLTDPALALPLERLLADFARAGELLLGRLGEIDPAAFAAPPAGDHKPDAQSLGQQLEFLLFHETYHVGQSGILRRQLGLPGAIK